MMMNEIEKKMTEVFRTYRIPRKGSIVELFNELIALKKHANKHDNSAKSVEKLQAQIKEMEEDKKNIVSKLDQAQALILDYENQLKDAAHQVHELDELCGKLQAQNLALQGGELQAEMAEEEAQAKKGKKKKKG